MPVWLGRVTVISYDVRAFNVEAPEFMNACRLGVPWRPSTRRALGLSPSIEMARTESVGRRCSRTVTSGGDETATELAPGRVAVMAQVSRAVSARRGVDGTVRRYLAAGNVTGSTRLSRCAALVHALALILVPTLTPDVSLTGMRLTVVGCSGSYPGPDSAASCYLLEADQVGADGANRRWRILLDLGNGSLGQLHNYVDPLTIDAVLLTHLHADHCLDMCGYYVMRKYHPTGPQPRIPVWGPVDTPNRLARAYDLTPEPGMSEEFDFRSHAGEVVVGPFVIEAHPVVHPVDAFALRITVAGRVLVYSGDTGPCQALDDAARDADLLLAEASFCEGVENPPEIHLTGADCGRTAATAQVGRLVLTHIPPWHDKEQALREARSVWDGQVDLASAGATYQV